MNLLLDVSENKRADALAERLVAIVSSSEDGIVSKDLNGVITSWNAGAERLFGYTAAEIVGQSIMTLIPEDRREEETFILSQLRQGKRIEHYETVRRRKDGSAVDVSLTVSPVRDASGQIIGASKIARDITERRRAAERQQLLLREMNHRVKNLFTLAGGVVSLSARSAQTAAELASAVRERLAALGRAHDLTLPKLSEVEAPEEQRTTLHALIETIVTPFERMADGQRRVRLWGADVSLSSSALTSFALLIHELTTNAAKYGALSGPDGYIEVACCDHGEQFVMDWVERGGPAVAGEPVTDGFGSLLARMTIQTQFKGEFVRDWRPEGLAIRLTMPRKRLGG